MFYGNLPKFGNKVKIAIKVKFGDMFKNLCNVWSGQSCEIFCFTSAGEYLLKEIVRKNKHNLAVQAGAAEEMLSKCPFKN